MGHYVKSENILSLQLISTLKFLMSIVSNAICTYYISNFKEDKTSAKSGCSESMDGMVPSIQSIRSSPAFSALHERLQLR